MKIEPLAGEVGTIAGVDCAFIGKESVIAAAVLVDARTLETLATVSEVRPCVFPYVPGLLSFREAPAIIAAVQKLPLRPDLLMIDGQGLAHPRGLGIACHVGLWLDMPTIGVAKSRLCGEHREPGRKRGCRVRLMFQGRQVGTVLRTRDGVKSLYISAGHKVTLDDCIAWTLRCCIAARLPEPTRRAHQLVTRLKSEL